jgi:hypothetical protein
MTAIAQLLNQSPPHTSVAPAINTFIDESPVGSTVDSLITPFPPEEYLFSTSPKSDRERPNPQRLLEYKYCFFL